METAIYKIEKAKIKDSQLTATYEERFKTENYSNVIEKKCSQIIHGDLKNAIDNLRVHLACICEMPEAERIRELGVYDFPADDLSNYIVTGYSHGGSNESAGVTIIGQKLLKSGKVLNLISPFIQFEDTDAYPFAGELCSEIEACDYEVDQYLFHEKYGIKQMELDFDVPEDVNVSITVDGVTKPVKRRRKKKTEIASKSFDETA